MNRPGGSYRLERLTSPFDSHPPNHFLSHIAHAPFKCVPHIAWDKHLKHQYIERGLVCALKRAWW